MLSSPLANQPGTPTSNDINSKRLIIIGTNFEIKKQGRGEGKQRLSKKKSDVTWMYLSGCSREQDSQGCTSRENNRRARSQKYPARITSNFRNKSNNLRPQFTPQAEHSIDEECVRRRKNYSSLSFRLPDSCLLVVLQPAILDRRPHPSHVLLHVLAVKLRRLRVRGAVRVRIVQQALDGREDRRDVVRRRPSVLENVEAELPVRVHVRMEHPREEFYRRGLVRVRFIKSQQEFECAVFERCVRCAAQGKRRKDKKIPIRWWCDAPGPKMTAFHSMMLSGHGLPEIPPGGSLDKRLKSRIRRLLQLVDYDEAGR